ncbi:hypothetical protein CRG98_035182 [Punica granatum]|uniref:Uncharacterized protein n=1 Tax=Punica granatum TaxID=22663 RepID=A0A2I0IL83_PUNGR|nr:hypothetical protein CRG98_035182 [Punica granatum]
MSLLSSPPSKSAPASFFTKNGDRPIKPLSIGCKKSLSSSHLPRCSSSSSSPPGVRTNIVYKTTPVAASLAILLWSSPDNPVQESTMFESSENAQYESKYIHLSANTSGESCAMEDDEGKRIAAIAARTQRECEARNLFAIIFRIELKMLQGYVHGRHSKLEPRELVDFASNRFQFSRCKLQFIKNDLMLAWVSHGSGIQSLEQWINLGG